LKIPAFRFAWIYLVAELVADLHSCLGNHSSYRINPVVFSDHAYNFRVESINALFGRLGVEGITSRLRYAPTFAEYLGMRFPNVDVRRLKQQEIDTVVNYLDDLAERRNEVAHGYVQETLTNPILLEYVEIIEAVGCGLCEVLDEEMAKFVYRYAAVELGKPKMVHGNDIICFDVHNKEITVGDTVIAKTGQKNRPYIAGTILELRSKDVAMQAVPQSSEPIPLGIKIGFKANEKHVYSWVPTPKTRTVAAAASVSEPANAFEAATDLDAEAGDFELTAAPEQAAELELKD
jgi:RiboL-PSP-HEPN